MKQRQQTTDQNTTMKTYKHTSESGFIINITWNEERTVLRIESGGEEDPQEMIAQFEGLSKWGAKAAIQLWVSGMIDGGFPIALILDALNLPA